VVNRDGGQSGRWTILLWSIGTVVNRDDGQSKCGQSQCDQLHVVGTVININVAKRDAPAINGTHIGIKRPKKDSILYCNRKGQYSILFQGVCNDKQRFIDVFCGETGSMHDTRVLKRSSLYRKCVSGNFLKGRYLLSDATSYPNLNWLVTPHKDMENLTNNKRIFNYRHSAIKIVIEHTFGLLKGRFRRLLNGFENNCIKFVVECVVAACILHNICINMDELNVEFQLIDEQKDVLPYDNNVNNGELWINNKRDDGGLPFPVRRK